MGSNHKHSHCDQDFGKSSTSNFKQIRIVGNAIGDTSEKLQIISQENSKTLWTRSDQNRWVQRSRGDEKNLIPWQQHLVIFNKVNIKNDNWFFICLMAMLVMMMMTMTIPWQQHLVIFNKVTFTKTMIVICLMAMLLMMIMTIIPCRRGSLRIRRAALTLFLWNAWTSITG